MTRSSSTCRTSGTSQSSCLDCDRQASRSRRSRAADLGCARRGGGNDLHCRDGETCSMILRQNADTMRIDGVFVESRLIAALTGPVVSKEGQTSGAGPGQWARPSAVPGRIGRSPDCGGPPLSPTRAGRARLPAERGVDRRDPLLAENRGQPLGRGDPGVNCRHQGARGAHTRRRSCQRSGPWIGATF